MSEVVYTAAHFRYLQSLGQYAHKDRLDVRGTLVSVPDRIGDPIEVSWPGGNRWHLPENIELLAVVLADKEMK